METRQAVQSADGMRQPYATPRMTIYGTIESLTQGGGGGRGHGKKKKHGKKGHQGGNKRGRVKGS